MLGKRSSQRGFRAQSFAGAVVADSRGRQLVFSWLNGRILEATDMARGRARWRIAPGWLVLLVGSTPGCAGIHACSLFEHFCPQIQRFEAVPQRLCQGNRTLLSWKVRGNATLSANPPTDGIGAVGAEGSRSFRPPQTTRFTLTAERGGESKLAEQDVQVISLAMGGKVIGGPTECRGREVVATFELPPSDWDDLAYVTAVVAGPLDEPRSLTVVHAGREAKLEAEVPSTAFSGTKASGGWEVRSPLGRRERCGDADAAPPTALMLTVQLECNQ